MHKQTRLVVVGCGDIGSRVAVLMQKHGWQVYGLRRNSARYPLILCPFQQI